MKHKGKNPLKVALHGMSERQYKMMELFLQGPCKGAAVVVEVADADIDIIDADFATAKDIFDERQKNAPKRPVIGMSLEHIKLENIIFLKKPVTKEGMLAALDLGRELTEIDEQSQNYRETITSDKTTKPIAEKTVPAAIQEKKPVDTEEQQKTAKHKASLQFNEGGFSAFIGILPDIDFDNRQQMLAASYDPKKYFQGYVSSAFKVAAEKGRILQLNSSWKPLLIFPQTCEVWVDADDQQLRAFAGLIINRAAKNSLSLTAVNLKTTTVKQSLDRFNSMDALMWKLAIWTSKGRYPVTIDIDRPLYLKRWPDFTRLVITPHALRIAALLIKEPRTLLNTAEILKIKLQYVFVFISACHALGWVDQPDCQIGSLIVSTEIKTNKSSGLFRKILGKLRASK